MKARKWKLVWLTHLEDVSDARLIKVDVRSVCVSRLGVVSSELGASIQKTG